MDDISQGLESRPIPCERLGNSPQDQLFTSFRYVRRSIPGLGSDRGLFEEQLEGCDCLDGCQPDSCSCLTRFGPSYHPHTPQLLSRVVLSSSLKPVLECNSQCPCDRSCSNRLVQRGPRVKLRVAPAGSRGLGLFASEAVERLGFICEYAGEVIGSSEARKRMARRDGGMNYLIVLREHCRTGVVVTCVDPEGVGNVGRFANHSCDPNLVMVPVRVDNSVPKLALFARRNISAGEELTFDYSGESLLNSLSVSDLVAQKFEDECDSALVTDCGTESPVKADRRVPVTENDFSEKDRLASIDCGNKASDRCGTSINTSGMTHSKASEKCEQSLNCVSVSCKGEKVNDALISQGEATDVTNERKRKYSEDKATSNSENLQKKLQAEHSVGSETGIGQTMLKVCLCGTAQCKGYLPFDHHILKSS